MPGRISCLLSGLLVVLTHWVVGAQLDGGAPTPLPYSPALAARVTVTGPFRSYITNEKRNLTLGSWVAEVKPGAPVDFSMVAGDAFQRLSLPIEEGWGFFQVEHAGPLTLTITVTDTMQRLGRVAVRKEGKGRPVAYLRASRGRGEVSGSVNVDWLDREFTAEVQDPFGAPIAVLAIDTGKYDCMFPLIFRGGFQPHVPRPSDTGGDGREATQPRDTAHDPCSLVGVAWVLGPARAAIGSVDIPYVHDNSGLMSFCPTRTPILCRRVALGGSWSAFDPNVEPASARKGLYDAMRIVAEQDVSQPLSPFVARPYSRGTAEWAYELRGEWTAAITVPYERMRLGGDAAWLQALVERTYRAGTGKPEERLASAARSVLSDARWERLLAFHASEVRPYSSAASVSIAQTGLRAVGEAPIMQDISLHFEAYQAPSGGSGEARITYDRPMTDPPAPGANTTIRAPIENWTSRVTLPQGHCWKIVADVHAPDLYVSGPREQQLLSTGMAEQTILVQAATMADLTVETVSQGLPVDAQISVKNPWMEIVGTGRTSANRTTGRCTFRFRACVAQGTLTIEAKAADGRRGTQTIFVPQPGLDHVTVELR